MLDVGFITSYQVPRQRDDHVPRLELLAKLEARSTARLQTVIAPAAYGKKTLLGEFAKQSSRHVCWLTIDESDADVVAFIRRVHSSVQVQFPGLAPMMTDTPRTGDVTSIKALVANLVNVIHGLGDVPITLIWDDFHRVDDEEQIQSAVGLFLNRMPNNCALLIGSRTQPNIEGIEKLFAYREAYTLSVEEMAFSSIEIRELLQVLRDTSVSSTQALEVHEKTGGWIGGVISLESGGLASGESLNGSRRNLRVFASAAIGGESDYDRWFLESTSVLPYLDPELCNEVLGTDRSSEVLARAYKHIGFLSQANEDARTYKWHDLVREGLEDKFSAENPEEFSRISKQAAEIFRTRRELDHSVSLLSKAGEHEQIVSLLSEEGERLLRDGRWVFLDRILARLPAAFLEKDPALLELQGRMAARLKDGETAIGRFNRALECIEGDQASDRVMVGRILVSRSSAYQLLGLYGEAVTDAERAIQVLREAGGTQQDMIRAQRQLGGNYIYQGQFGLGEDWLLKTLPAVKSSGDAFESATVNGLLGWACVELGKTSEGHLYLNEAVQGWRKLGNLGELSIGLNNLAQLWYKQGQLDMARSVLEEALKYARDSAFTRFEAIILVGLGDVARANDDFGKALMSYELGLKLARQCSEANLISYTVCVTGETYRLQEEYEKSEVLLRQSLTLAKSQGQLYEQALAMLYLALLRARRGDYRNARLHLTEAESPLTQSKNAYGMALLDLYTAQIAFLERDLSACEHSLESLSNRCRNIDYHGFLIPEARRAPMMFQWAASKGVGGGLYQQVWDESLAQRTSADSINTRITGRLSLDVQVHAFGHPHVSVGEELVSTEEWQSPKAKEMFYYFLTRAHPLRKESVCADLWPEANSITANNNFHSSLRRLRRAVHPAMVVLEDGVYEISPYMDIWYDFGEFRDRLGQAEELPRGSQERARMLEGAVQCYKGPFLEDFYSEWVETIRREAQSQFLKALSSLAGFYSGENQFKRALGFLQRADEIDQLEEDVRVQMMHCLLAMGDAPSAAHVYEDYKYVLESELGTQPSLAMQRLYGEAVSAL